MKIESSIEKVSRDKAYKSVKNVKSVYLSVTWMPPLTDCTVLKDSPS